MCGYKPANAGGGGRKYIEISGIPQSIKQIDLEKTVLNIFDKILTPVDPQNVEVYHRLK